MRMSFRFARVLGIDLKIHITFLLVVLLAMLQGRVGGTFHLPTTIFWLGFILLLFVCVTLHELGHSIAAMRYGIAVKEIVLLPIGGVAVMGRIPEKPRQELIIAVAGPLVNVLILAVLGPIWFFTGGGEMLRFLRDTGILASPDHTHWGFAMLSMLIYANAMLIAFNLIPAFPLDGGRIFRALLAMKLPHVRATRIAATVGQFAAVLLGLWGLFGGGGITLVIIAVFVFLGAGAEAAASQAGTVLATRRVGDAYNKTAIVLSLDHRVSHVLDYLLTSYQPDFAVVNRGRLLGVLTRDELFRWMSSATSRYDVYVTEVMREEPNVLKVDASLTLDEVTKAMADTETRIAAVVDQGVFLGLVSMEDISEAQAVLTLLGNGPLEGPPMAAAPWPMPFPQVPRN